MLIMNIANENHNFSRNLICIEYPGVVENVDKMLETLGGLNTVSSVFSQKKRRLELRFRPDDIFSKPACGDRHSTSALLLRIKVKRKKRKILECEESDAGDGPENDNLGEILSCESNVVGQISTVYRFTSMCDFQYLPVINDNQGNIKSAYEEVVPLGVKNYSWIVNEDAPLFIPPPSFSRMDMPQSYAFRRGKTETEMTENAHSKAAASGNVYPKNVIGRTRCRRSLHTIFVSWHKVWASLRKQPSAEAIENPAQSSDGNHSENGRDNPNIPSSGASCTISGPSSSNLLAEGTIPIRPQETAVRLLRIKFLCGEPFLRIQKHLEERPIWSKNALFAVTKLTQDQLKYLLPAVAYYFVNGPWRGTWARFGYDPTTNPSSRKYQTLDFRLRRFGRMGSKIKAKRSSVNCSQPYKWSSNSRSKVAMIKKMTIVETKDEDDLENDPDKMESLYIFRPGLLPPSMQMFYQYCDLQVPEIQALLEKLPLSGPDVVCTERTGWLPAGIDEKCRDIINNYVLQKIHETSKSS